MISQVDSYYFKSMDFLLSIIIIMPNYYSESYLIFDLAFLLLSFIFQIY